MADYRLNFTAAEIDEKLSSINNKQNKLTGTQGQIVGFDAGGNAVATDDYKNAILLDGEMLKNTSGEDITDNVKVLVSEEPFIIEAECIYSPGIGSVLSNPRFQDSFITGEEISAAYNAGRELQLSLLVEDRHETLYFWYAEVASSSSFIGIFAEGDSHAVVAAGSNGIIEEYSPFYKVNMPMGGSTSSTAGTSGLVPAPAAGDEGKFLKGDGTWATVESGVTSVNGQTGNVNLDIPPIIYSTTDLIAGESELAAGTLYFVYD